MRILLVSTYDLGHQPFGLASPAAWLRAAGHRVCCADLSCRELDEGEARAADLVAFYLPMHTATRLAVKVIRRVRAVNPPATICCYGLYAPLNAELLRGLGVDAILEGEFESGLTALARGERPETPLPRQRFLVPDRAGLPPAGGYARLIVNGEMRLAGYTEATRGCKHLCRHCPIVPVYGGAFRVVPREVVLADVRNQAALGARHITFGDPDFFNGPGHAVRIVEALHTEFPKLTYDATIKIEHLLRHRDLLPVLKRTGCLFVTSAVESLDDAVLARLNKGHTRADFLEAVRLTREADLPLAPTFIPFTPWTTEAGYRDLLETIAELELVENVAPVQLAMRLLITNGSPLLELPEIRAIIGPFDRETLAYPWSHALDGLCREAQQTIRESNGASRTAFFGRLWSRLYAETPPLRDRAAIPYMTEPWYC
ncbi:MAG: CUAEP/CCAEP-tail radical SAM (seleno)protein [Bryobacteraceae bacterium]